MAANPGYDPNRHGRYKVKTSTPSAKNERKGDDLQLLGKGVKVHFLRYGYFKTENSKIFNSTIAYNSEIETFELNKSKQDKWLDSVEVKLPDQEKFKVAPTVLNEGFLYIFDDNDIDLHYEFRVSSDGGFNRITWDDNREIGKDGKKGKVKDIRIKTEKNKTYSWLLQKDREMSVAFSYVQWSVAYHTKVKNNIDGLRTKRCHSFLTDPYMKNNTSEGGSGYSLNLESVFIRLPKEIGKKNNRNKIGYKDSLLTTNTLEKYKYYVEREAKNNDEYKEDIFVVLEDPVGAVLDIMNIFALSLAYFISFVESIQTGRSPFGIYYNRYKGSDALKTITSKGLTSEQKGVRDMFNFTAQVYQFLHAPGNYEGKYTERSEGFFHGVDEDKVVNILAVTERKNRRTEIRWIQDAIRKVIFYQDVVRPSGVMFDFIDDESNKKAKLFGKSLTAGLLAILATNPHDVDRIYDIEREIEYEQSMSKSYDDHLLKLLNKSYPDNPFNKLLFVDIDILTVDIDDDVKEYCGTFFTQTITAFKRVASKGIDKGKKLKEILESITGEGETFFESDEKNISKKYSDGSVYTSTVLQFVQKIPKEYVSADLAVGDSPEVRGTLNPATKVYTLPKAIGDVDNILNRLTPDAQEGYSYGRVFAVISNRSIVGKILDSGYYAGALQVLAVYNFHDCLQAEFSVRKGVDVIGNSVALAQATLVLTYKVAPSALRRTPIVGGFFVTEMAAKNTFNIFGKVAGAIGALVAGIDAYNTFNADDNDAGLAYSFAAVALACSMFGGPFGLAAAIIGIGLLCLAASLTDDRLEAFLKHIPLNNHKRFKFKNEFYINNLKFYHKSTLKFIDIESDSIYNFIENGNYNYLQAQTAFIEVRDQLKSIEQCPQEGDIDTGVGDEEAYFVNRMETHIYSGLLDFSKIKIAAQAYFVDEYIFTARARKMATEFSKEKDKNGKEYIKIDITPNGKFGKWDKDWDDAVLQLSFTLSNGTRIPFEKDKFIVAVLDWEGYYDKREKTYYFNNKKKTKESEIKIETQRRIEKGKVN